MSKMFWFCAAGFVLLVAAVIWYVSVAGKDTPVSLRSSGSDLNIYTELNSLQKTTTPAQPKDDGDKEKAPVADEFPVSPQEIADYYNANKARFVEDADPKESMRAAHILVKTSAQASSLLARLRKNPDDFAALAKAHSTCSSKDSGGDLGVFQAGDMVKDFENAVRALKPGEISGVVKTQFGYHIIRRDPIRTGRQMTLAESTGQIRHILREAKKDAKMRERLGNVL